MEVSIPATSIAGMTRTLNNSDGPEFIKPSPCGELPCGSSIIPPKRLYSCTVFDCRAKQFYLTAEREIKGILLRFIG